MKYFFRQNKKPNAAIFLSGSGTNAEQLLKTLDTFKNKWNPAVIVTDKPKTSKASFLSEKFNLPLISLDIKDFYHEHGESRISIKTIKGQEIREKWTNKLRFLLSDYSIDFGILAGFIPLSNITSDFPCLNVHPGDLTFLKNNTRHLVGLHTVPIERAILANLATMRTSVIVAQAYTGQGGEMDSGPILGISVPVKINLMNHSLEELKNIAQKRLKKRPMGGYKDILEEVAEENQELLKINGDWEVFPPTVAKFADSLYAMDENNQLMFKNKINWEKIKTIEYKGKNEYKSIIS